MKPQLVLMRILRRPATPSSARTPSPGPREPVHHHTGTAQWDSNHPFHLAVLEGHGILQTYTLETANGGSQAELYPCVAFQLHLFFTGGNNNNHNHESGNKCDSTTRKEWNEDFEDGLKPIKQPWGSFEFIPKRPGEIIFFQAESSRILFAQLPGGSPRSAIYSSDDDDDDFDDDDEKKLKEKIDRGRSKVFCVGRHSSTILSIAIRPDGLALVSAGRDGCLRIWRLSDGTMIAQTMFARWREPRNPGIGRVSPLRRQNDEIDCAYPALRVISFFGKSWYVAMGCPSGEVRTWTQQLEEGSSELTIKTISESETLFSGKHPISSIALHVPDTNFPSQRSDDEYSGDDHEWEEEEDEFRERVAVGTSNGKLQVWTRRKSGNEWRANWSTSPSAEGASIVCLSFRADGGLLAAAASFLAKQLTDEETESLLLSSPTRKIKRLCERIYLYETCSWACVWTVNFSSQVGSCLFYRPHFREEDKRNPRSFMSLEKVSSCRVLLVATASGPQAHILPEFGLFEFRKQRQNQFQKVKQHHQHHSSPSRRETKTVRWADRDRGGGWQSSPSSSSPVRDRNLKSAPAACETRCSHRCEREQLRPVTADDSVWNSRSRTGRTDARRNASANPKSRSPPRSHSPACSHGCEHPLRKLRIPVRDPYQDPSLLSLPPECVGVPMDVVMKYRAGTRQGAAKGKTKNCVCCSKRARSKELPVPYPMGQVVVQNIKNVAAPKQRSSGGSPVKQPPRKKRVSTPTKACKSATSSLHDTAPCLPNPRSDRSRSMNPRVRRKPRTMLSKKFADPNFDADEASDHEEESVRNTAPQFHHQEFPPVFQHHEQALSGDRIAHAGGEISSRDEDGNEAIRTEEQEDAGPEREEEVHDEEISFSCDQTAEGTDEELGHHRYRQQQVAVGSQTYSVTGSDCSERKQPFHEQNISFRNSPKFDQEQDLAAPHSLPTSEGSAVSGQQQHQPNAPAVGVKSIPDKPVVGGNELEDFLVEERNPLKFVGPEVRKMATEQNLLQPEPFSTTKLMARLKEIEQETFSLEAALRVAKLKGIELDEEDERDLRKALEEERKLQVTADRHDAPQPKSKTNGVRYTQLTKISDPRVSHSGPLLAPRKVRKQVDPKWEDMRTKKPALSDLWDVKDRYAQVCSPGLADIDHHAVYRAFDRDEEDGEMHARREVACLEFSSPV
ncbi:hypothetical protein R1sor_016002 [Riccia sorocarpa]|uniref:Uncharacterized protein n=1 Tax=Riccia sorocarpa TaxID=122646 RepID=A0ABD3HE54_9MARC